MTSFKNSTPSKLQECQVEKLFEEFNLMLGEKDPQQVRVKPLELKAVRRNTLRKITTAQSKRQLVFEKGELDSVRRMTSEFESR